jgi:lipoprotein NlpI
MPITTGGSFLRSGRKITGLDDFKQASNLIPKTAEYASVFNNMGVIYTHLNQYQLAIDNYNEALSLDQHYAAAYNNRAYAYIKK